MKFTGKFRRLISSVLLGVLVLVCVLPSVKAADTPAVLRVAYCPLDNFFEYDDSGTEIGYGVDLLNKISQYSGIRFEYVKTDSWEDTKQMLLDGTADLRMPATRPSTPSTTLGYNSTSIMSTYNVILCLNSRDDLYYQDYDTIKTLKIAVCDSFYSVNSIQNCFDSIGVTKDQLVLCPEYNDCRDLLEAGKVDALVSNVMDMEDGMKMLARFDSTYNYFSMTLNNPQLDILDRVLTEIQLDEPNFLTNLYAKWFPSRTAVPYTREESAYLSSIDSLTFAFRTDEGYLSRRENGTYYGIYVELAKTICDTLGVDFHAVSIPDCQAGNATADVYAGFFYDQNYAAEWNYSISSPINDINYYIIKKKEASFDTATCRIGAIEQFRYTKEYLQKQYPDAHFLYYDSYEDCLRAVESGTADMTIINNYIAEYYLDMYQFNNLSAKLSDEYSHLFCFAADQNNEVLSSLLTKAIQQISDDELSQIYARGQEIKPEVNFLQAMIYQNPIATALFVIVLLGLLLTIVFLFFYGARRKKQNQILSEALSAKSDFLARMSHDMRTPMNGILGVASLLQDQEMSDSVREGLSQIQMSGDYLLGLINDTLDVSKIESNHLELHPVPTNAQKITANILSNARLLSREKGVQFSVEKINPEAITPVILKLDCSRVEQIFMNLISNAVKFTPAGGQVQVSIERLETTDDYVRNRYVIHDTGIGMSQEFLAHLYEPFAQESRINTERENGTGLGLSIVKRLVELMGGEITVESQENVGTTFTLTLRFDRCAGPLEQSESPILDDGVLVGKRILLCEDHPLNRQIAERLLEKKEILVETAENGQLGVDKFAASAVGCFDLILMDLRMPVLNGYEATEQIRKLDRPDAKTIPILAMTANAFDEDVQKCLAAGMNDHIAKPIDVSKLYETLTKYLSKS